MLQRSRRLLVHELAHLKGVDHCIYYSCCMNGASHLNEDFRQPMHICPVDLRKLAHLCGYDITQRYRNVGHVVINEFSLMGCLTIINLSLTA
jgi:archaemetzincin